MSGSRLVNVVRLDIELRDEFDMLGIVLQGRVSRVIDEIVNLQILFLEALEIVFSLLCKILGVT